MLSLLLALKRRRGRRAVAERALEQRDRSFAITAAAQRQEQLLREYGRGFTAGVEETLDQLAGCTRFAAGGAYAGPRPEELDAWIDDVRRRVVLERSK